jgi:hypothetical protein
MAYRDRAEEYGGHPGVATGVCTVLLLASLASGSADAPMRNNAEMLGNLMGGAFFGAILWGISYAITIKRASPGWKAGSLIALMVTGLLVSILKLGAHGNALHEDAAARRQQMQGVLANGVNSAPITPGADAGPLTRMGAMSVNRIMADAKAFDAESKAAGLQQLLSFDGITYSSPLLDHCDRIAALTVHAGQIESSFPAYIAASRKEGDAAVAAGTLTQDALDGFIEGAAKSRAGFERQWTLVGQITTDATGLCRLLARRHWRRGADGKILFPTAELHEAQPILARIDKAGAEVEQIRGAARDNVQSDMAKMDKI